MKISRNRIISSILVTIISITTMFIVYEKAINLITYTKSFFADSNTDTKLPTNNGNEELDELQSRIENYFTLIYIKFPMHRELNIEDFSHLKILNKLSILSFEHEAINQDKEFIGYFRKKMNNDQFCNVIQSKSSNNSDQLVSILKRLENFVIYINNYLTYEEISEAVQNHFLKLDAEFCGPVSIQQRVYEICKSLIDRKERVFLTCEFLYRKLLSCYQGDYTNEIESTFGEILDQIYNYKKLLSTIVTDLSRVIKPCEPKPNSRNIKYFEFERLNRIIPVNDIQMSPSHECTNKCRENFGKLLLGKTMDSSYTINMTYCELYKNATLHGLCRKVPDSSGYFMNMTYKQEQGKDNYYVPSQLTNSSMCKERKQMFSPHNDGYNCTDCLYSCTNPDTDIKWRYAISLRPQESNISENMIVTGIRFHKKNNPNGVKVIYPQIKVAKLFPGGLSQGVWKDVGNFDNGSWPSGKTGVDYVILGRDEDQSMIMNLNENREKPSYVVTGVKFQQSFHSHVSREDGDKKNKALEISVRLTPYNYNTGILLAAESSYTKPQRDIIHNTTCDQCINITHSSLPMDFGQTTIPYIDLQSVDPKPAFPLSGIDLYHRADNMDRRFLGFKVKTVNISELEDFQNFKIFRNYINFI